MEGEILINCKTKSKLVVVYLLVLIMVINVSAVDTRAAVNNTVYPDDTLCIEFTPQLNQATEDYLNEVYIERFPNLGLEIDYGSPDDIAMLQTLSDKITEKYVSEKDKAEAISRWCAYNLNYTREVPGVAHFPIDVFLEREANCVGYAQLIQCLLRLEGIPAVVGYGYRKNMEVLTKSDILYDFDVLGHAWVYVYIEGEWKIYDPLNGVLTLNDKEKIDKYYLPQIIEGVHPYYEGMDFSLMGKGVFYIDGNFWMYDEEGNRCESTSHIFEINGYIWYWSNTDDMGWRKLDNIDSNEEGIGACCSGGLYVQMVTIVEDYITALLFVKDNGIALEKTIVDYEDKSYYISHNVDAYEINSSNPEKEINLKDGYIILYEGETIQLKPFGLDVETMDGKIVITESASPEIATIDEMCNITGKSEGIAELTIMTKDSVDSDTWYMYKSLKICVLKKKRVPVYENFENLVVPVTPPTTEEPIPDDPVTPPTELPTPSVDVTYHTHIQTLGDSQGTKKNGEMAGTSGMAKRLENIWIKVEGNDNLGIQYTTHCQTYGWMPWSCDGEANGTSKESKRLEAIKIQLTGADKDKYDVYYRVHAQSYGWLGWAKNGEPSGTAGYAKRLEGIQVVVVKKGEAAPGLKYAGVDGSSSKYGKQAYVAKTNEAIKIPGNIGEPNVMYQTHVQTYGWQKWMVNGQMSGTSGKSKRLEGINIKLTNAPYEGDIVYTTHVQKYGWKDGLPSDTTRKTWKKNGAMSGTNGEAKRLEAICIDLTGEMAEHYDVYYRVHAQTFGWLGWAKNGEESGTAGYAKRLEGIQIVLVPKGGATPADNYGGITSMDARPFISK